LQNTSQEYQDACDLWELYLRLKNEAISEAFGELNQGVDTFSNVEEDKEDKLIPSREVCYSLKPDIFVRNIFIKRCN
jgi:hypothetical protein